MGFAVVLALLPSHGVWRPSLPIAFVLPAALLAYPFFCFPCILGYAAVFPYVLGDPIQDLILS